MSEPIAGWSWEDLGNTIDSEGFDYFFRFYRGSTDALDEDLRAAWVEYEAAAQRLESVLRANGVDI